MPTILSEPVRAAEYIVEENDGNGSREVVLIAGGATAKPVPGTVLGKVTASGKFAPLNVSATDGSQTAAAIYYGLGYVVGPDLRCTAHLRDMSANGLLLTWPAGITASQQAAAIAQLLAAGIKVRT